ncbi:hypothetical protein BVRB_3g066870 [Beta vulgaris subsp. vulgaris]|nr:hypothetical protein BVRB_3g066870 [Beta vulgaris subsp. vulgaris]
MKDCHAVASPSIIDAADAITTTNSTSAATNTLDIRTTNYHQWVRSFMCFLSPQVTPRDSGISSTFIELEGERSPGNRNVHEIPAVGYEHRRGWGVSCENRKGEGTRVGEGWGCWDTGVGAGEAGGGGSVVEVGGLVAWG